MIKKFAKFMKNKNRGHHKRYKNENENFTLNFNCYGCGETGHVKVDFALNFLKNQKFFKKKKWDDNDSSSSSNSSSSSESNEEANLCLLVDNDSSD